MQKSNFFQQISIITFVSYDLELPNFAIEHMLAGAKGNHT